MSAPPAPTVTAIVIFWNAETFLQAAIDSVFAQSFGDWELLLVDDGSDDGSTEIARRCAALNPERVRYLQHEDHRNHGMSATRNLGLAHARGEFVAFLDADDVWLPNKLRHQLERIERHPEVGVVYGPTLYWYGWTGAARDQRRDHYGRTGFTGEVVVPPPELLVTSLRTEGGTMPGICSLLIRRHVLEAVGGFEDEFRGSYEDQVLLSKLFAHTPVLVTDRCTDRYRQHDRSHCALAKQSGEYDENLPHPARERYLHWLAAYVERTGLRHDDLRHLLERSLAVYRHPRRHAAWRRVERAVRRPIRIGTKAVRLATPKRFRTWLRGSLADGHLIPPVGWVRFGSLRRLAPVSRDYGYDRGQAIDRYYIERFLGDHAGDVRGHVLEIGEKTYTERFGGGDVTASDVLHIHPGHPDTTIVADLAQADHVPSNAFDCVVITQTLQLIYDVHAAVATLHRILRPGGVVLATFPGLSQISSAEWGGTWYWGFTPASATRLFGERFAPDHVELETYGNVLATTAFLQGLASRELRQAELDHRDPDYPLLLCVRARKGTDG